MDEMTVPFKCEKCKKQQEQTLGSIPLPTRRPQKPQEQVELNCHYCNHRQWVKLPMRR